MRHLRGDERVLVKHVKRKNFMQTLLDRARENTLHLLADYHRIIAAVRAGRIGLSAKEVVRLEARIVEHEGFLKTYANELLGASARF